MPSQIKQEELQEFWEWCGVTPERINRPPFIDERGTLPYYLKYPILDLNNLFKYMPKEDIETVQFSWGDGGCHCWIYTKKVIGQPYHGKGSTEALALYQAIQKARRKDNG